MGVFDPSVMREAAVASAAAAYRRRLEAANATRLRVEGEAKGRFRRMVAAGGPGVSTGVGRARLDAEVVLFSELAAAHLEHVVEVSLAGVGYEQAVSAAHVMSSMVSGSGRGGSVWGGVPDAARILTDGLGETLRVFRAREGEAREAYFAVAGRGRGEADRFRGAVDAARGVAAAGVRRVLGEYEAKLAELRAAAPAG